MHRSASKILLSLVSLIFAICVLLVGVLISLVVAQTDNAAANAVFAISLILSIAIVYFWLLRRRIFPVVARVGIALLPILFVAVFAAFFRFDGFTGEMLPLFRTRWSPREASISAALSSNGDKSKSDTVSEAFQGVSSTQFLGNARNGNLPSIALTTDWRTHPPQQLWRHPIGMGWASFAVRDGIAVTLEQPRGADSEQALALDLSTGKPLWVVKLAGTHYHPAGNGGPRTTPAIDGEFVYVASSAGKVAAIRLTNGELTWQIDLCELSKTSQADFEAEVTWGRSGSPLIVGETLFVPLGGTNSQGHATLLAVNKRDGSETWRAGNEQIGYASPQQLTIDGVDQIVLVSEKNVCGYATQDGKILWSQPWASQSNGSASTSQAALIDSGRLLISKGYGTGCEVFSVQKQVERFVTKTELTNSKSLKTKFTSAIIHNGCAYGLNDGRLECVELTNLERKWMQGRYGHGQVLLCGNKLIVSSEDGELAIVDASPNAYTELAKQEVLHGITWNIPTLAGDLLLMRNAEEAVCLRLPTGSVETDREVTVAP